MNTPGKFLLYGLAALALLAAGLLIGNRYSKTGSNSNESEQPVGHDPDEIEKILAIPKPRAPVEPVSVTESQIQIDALAPLSQPNPNPQRDIRVLDHLFREIHSVFHELPIGENREIVAFLLGENSKGIAYIPSDSPYLNGNGELIDRWGHPYFFHFLSRDRVEVRSAGPDRVHWSEDDFATQFPEAGPLQHM